ncbi:MAG: PIN domain-containing protein [Caulobacterales bacterium]|nr:PIN domain-containing protein [Caulobacterales bacterium]
MAVALDANYLIAWQQPGNMIVPEDPATGAPITKFAERVEYLIAQLEQTTTRIVIPTPALSEFLVRAGAAGAPVVALLSKNKNFRIAEFDRRAAIEAAEIIRHEFDVVGRQDSPTDTRSKVKFDIQIAAIAKIAGVDRVYTGDQGLANKCRRQALTPVMFYELPLPPDDTPPLFKYADDKEGGDS